MSSSIGEIPSASERVWFLISAGAHEGPYSFLDLHMKFSSGAVAQNAMVWAKGWPQSVALRELIRLYEQGSNKGDELPPLPIDDEVPDFSVDEYKEPTPTAIPVRKGLLIGGLFLAVMLGEKWATKTFLSATLSRPKEISVNQFRTIEAAFNGLKQPVPVPMAVVGLDLSQIFVVDKGTQKCQYEGRFSSPADQNLSGAPVAFIGRGVGDNHWVRFKDFEFSEGQRLMPGHYLVSLIRSRCGVVGIAGLWEKPYELTNLSFSTRLFTGTPEEFELALQKMVQQKRDAEKVRFERAKMAWRDVEEKLRTLSAISMQIESGFQSLAKKPGPWKKRLDGQVLEYTKQFGSFLTHFTIKSDEDFQNLSTLDIPSKVQLMGSQPQINSAAKRIGFLSMALIEKLQGQKKQPPQKNLDAWVKDLGKELQGERDKIQKWASEAQQMATQKN